MRVYNLTGKTVSFRGKELAPFGSDTFDLKFIPNRDLELAKAGILSFGNLPKKGKKLTPKTSTTQVSVAVAKVGPLSVSVPAPTPVKSMEVLAVVEEVSIAEEAKPAVSERSEKKDWKKK